MTQSPRPGWWLRLGGPNAISLPAWLLTLPGAAFASGLSEPQSAPGHALEWIAIGTVAHCVDGVLLWLCRQTLLSPAARPSRPWVYVGCVGFAGAVRGALVVAANEALGFPSIVSPLPRIAMASVSLLVWWSMATLIVDGARRHRATVRSLREQLERQQLLAAESARYIREFRADMTRTVQDTVVEQLQHAIGLSADPQVAARRLREVADDVVRPLSHELERRAEREADLLQGIAIAGGKTHLPLRDYFVAMFTARPFSPALSTAISFATTAPLTMLSLGIPLGALSLAVYLGLLFAGSQLARRLLAGRSSTPTAHIPVVGVGAVWSGTAFVAAFSLQRLVAILDVWPPSFGEVARVGVIVTMTTIGVIAQAAAAMDGSITRLRRRVEAELRRATRAVEWAQARLRQQAWNERRHLGRILHGDVQSRIVSLALQIQLNPPADTPAAINALALQVREALDEETVRSWRTELRDITALWSAAIRLEVRLEGECERMLDADAVAAQALVEVVREGVSNAVRHGGADAVYVKVAPCPGGVACMIRDDGRGPEGEIQPGMGSRLLDAVCMEWSLTRDHGTLLQTVIACGSESAFEEVRVA